MKSTKFLSLKVTAAAYNIRLLILKYLIRNIIEYSDANMLLGMPILYFIIYRLKLCLVPFTYIIKRYM